MSCIVFGCPNGSADTADQSVHYYIFPKHPTIAQQWIQASGIESDQIDPKTAKICSLHFDEDSYSLNGVTRILKHDALPKLHLPTEIIINPPKPNQDKYKQIKTSQQLTNLMKENKRLREKIASLENRLKVDKDLLDNKRLVCLKLGGELATKRYMSQKNQILTLYEQRQLLSKVFSERQIKMLTGKKRVAWADDDMAMGLTIRHLSNKRCYLYLTRNLNIPLPGVSSIKRWLTQKRDKLSTIDNE